MHTIRRLFAVATLALAAAAPSLAQPFAEGRDYFRIEPAQPTGAPAGKVEVLEVFSYGCGACAAIQPHVDAWKQRMPASATFAYMPVTFSSVAQVLARGYYAAEALGAPAGTHAKMFDAVRAQGRIATIDDVAAVYEGLGLTREDFLAAARSFAVEARVKRSIQSLPRLGVDATPTFVVAGKYRVTGPSAGSYERLFQIVDFLVAKETAASG